MSKQDVVRTYPVKGLVIFLSIVMGLSALVAVLNYFLLKDNLALQIVIWIFCGIFLILSPIVLFKEALVYVSFDRNKNSLIIHGAILKKEIPLSEISRVENKEGFYIFYKGKNELYRIGAERKGAGALILALEKNGTNIKW